MARNAALSEDEIVHWLIELIEDGELFGSIDGVDNIEEIEESFSQDAVIPAFGFDHLSRRANIRAAATVLDTLTMLEIVSVNKSISLTTGEILRPDILCFNPESRTFVVFEVKRDKLTERQAVTELAGYEQELRNALPFIGGYEVNFVVVSTHWDDLLEHAVTNYNTWSSKHCLALKVEADSRPFSMACYIPNAWQMRGGVGLPDDALQTIDLCLYEDSEDENSNILPPALVTAMESIARSGDRFGSHGFALLWKDTGNIGAGCWTITLCGIDPMAMHAWCLKSGITHRASELTAFIEKHTVEASFQVPKAVYRIAKEAFPLMGNRYRPEFESAYPWEEKLRLIRDRGVPVYFEFWGALGDYVREFVAHPGVRDRYFPFIEQNSIDWHDPRVAVPLLANVCEDVPFPRGIIRCRAAFEAGIVIGLFESLAQAADQSADQTEETQAYLESLLRWAFFEVIRVQVEMCEIYRTACEVIDPPPPISMKRESRLSSVQLLSEWVLNNLIGDGYKIHQQCFEIGRSGAPCLSDWYEEDLQVEFLDEYADELVVELRKIIIELVRRAEDLFDDFKQQVQFSRFLKMIGIDPQSPLPAQISKIDAVSAETLLAAFQSTGVDGLDEILPAVHHTTKPLAPINIDWDGLRQAAIALFESGKRKPTVILSQNGQFGIGEMPEEISNWLPTITDPNKVVYFFNEKASFSMSVRMTWAELRAKVEAGEFT